MLLKPWALKGMISKSFHLAWKHHAEKIIPAHACKIHPTHWAVRQVWHLRIAMGKSPALPHPTDRRKS